MPRQESANLQLIVTIDGPAGAGKSTVARQVAQRLGLDYLDTGAMYRGVAAAAISRGIAFDDPDAVAEMAEGLNIRFNWSDDPPTLKIDGIDVTHRLRDADVTAGVPEIASNPGVRRVLVRAQRWIGYEHPALVTEGRDQGSVVFPDAAVKLFLDASPAVRARRRANQLREMGRLADEQKILHEIEMRDQRDRTRRDGPLICPDDATVIDTSDLTMEQVIQTLVAHVQQTPVYQQRQEKSA